MSEPTLSEPFDGQVFLSQRARARWIAARIRSGDGLEGGAADLYAVSRRIGEAIAHILKDALGLD